MDEFLLRCHCGAPEFVEFCDLDEDLLFIGFYAQPRTLWGRLVAAWQALRGEKFYYQEVLVGRPELLALREWLDR